MALIDIGSRKQLFVDDYLIESMTNTRQVLNPAEKVENNPVLKPERPWEGNDVRPRRIVFDDRDGVYKMWYDGRLNEARQGDGEIIVTGEADAAEVKCLAVSEDGVHWERPNLGLVEFAGSKNNNLLPRTHMLPYGPDMTTYFFKDTNEEDPSRRYKGLVRTGSTTTPEWSSTCTSRKTPSSGFLTRTTPSSTRRPRWAAGGRRTSWAGTRYARCTPSTSRTASTGALRWGSDS